MGKLENVALITLVKGWIRTYLEIKDPNPGGEKNPYPDLIILSLAQRCTGYLSILELPISGHYLTMAK